MTNWNEAAHPDLRATNALGMHRDLGGCDACRAEDQPLTDNAYELLLRMAADAINGVEHYRFAEASEDEITDELHPNVFADALERETMNPHSAADISDAIYEGLSLRYAARYREMMEGGLI